MPGPTDAVDEQLDAYNARDLERFVRCYAEAAIITSSSGDVLADGHDGIRTMYGPLFEASPDLSARIAKRLVAGNFVADHEQVDGFNRPGLPTSLEAIAVYEVTDGVISRVVLFF